MKQSKKKICLLKVCFIFLILNFLLFAEMPRVVTYQGYVFENNQPVTGKANMNFKIVSDDSSGNELPPLWENGSVDVFILNGVYTFPLGVKYPEQFKSINWNQPLYLKITVGTTEQPRIPLLAVPYALQAYEALRLGGVPALDILARLAALELLAEH